jgi:hypothetical protein
MEQITTVVFRSVERFQQHFQQSLFQDLKSTDLQKNCGRNSCTGGKEKAIDPFFYMSDPGTDAPPHTADLLTSDPWSNTEYLTAIQELAPLVQSIKGAHCSNLQEALRLFQRAYAQHPELEWPHSFWIRQIHNQPVGFKAIIQAVSWLLNSYFRFLHVGEHEHKHHKHHTTNWLDRLYQESTIGSAGEMILLSSYRQYLEPSQLTKETYSAWCNYLKKRSQGLNIHDMKGVDLKGVDLLLDNFRGWIEYALTAMYLVEFLRVVEKGQQRLQHHCVVEKS